MIDHNSIERVKLFVRDFNTFAAVLDEVSAITSIEAQLKEATTRLDTARSEEAQLAEQRKANLDTFTNAKTNLERAAQDAQARTAAAKDQQLAAEKARDAAVVEQRDAETALGKVKAQHVAALQSAIEAVA